MVRVSGNAEPDAYTAVGERCTARMLGAVAAFTQRPVVDVLDWGCGPGRMTVHLAARPELKVYGCDVDAEAITWCQGNIKGDFAVSPLYPPLPYQEASFDAVLAMSVFTHLNRRLQRRWLRDLARVLRPGGVLVASVHGRLFAESSGVRDLSGINDHYLNLGLNGVVPDGYYRDVIQAEAYTRSAWSDWFDVVGYREAALELHDLLACRVKP
jgi:SAM-dependent methyltransferase